MRAGARTLEALEGSRSPGRGSRAAAAVLGLMACAPVVAAAGYVGLGWLVARVPALAVLLPGVARPEDGLALRVPLAAAGVVAVPFACLLLEASVLGYERSALRRLLRQPSRSARNDLFHLLLRGSGLMSALAFVLSFGSVYWLADRIHEFCDVGVLRGVSFPAQLAAVATVHTFLFYWAHRLMHHAWLWEIHKVHHAALEMNVVTPTRNHPVDLIVMTVVYSGPAALLGASVEAALAYQGANALYQCLVHSNLDVRSAWLEWLVITPNAHRVHHSNRPEHWGRNFGILTLWDRLFGTYLPPDDGPLTYGVDDAERFNTGRSFRELWAVLAFWLRGLRGGPRAASVAAPR